MFQGLQTWNQSSLHCRNGWMDEGIQVKFWLQRQSYCIYGWTALLTLWWSSVPGSTSKTLRKLYISRLCRKGLLFILGRRLSGMKNDCINEYVWFFACSLRDIVKVCMKAIIIIVHSARKTDQCNSYTRTTVKIIINRWARGGAIRLVELGNYCLGKELFMATLQAATTEVVITLLQSVLLTHLIGTRIWLWGREKLYIIRASKMAML